MDLAHDLIGLGLPAEKIYAAPADIWLGAVIAGTRVAFAQGIRTEEEPR